MAKAGLETGREGKAKARAVGAIVDSKKRELENR